MRAAYGAAAFALFSMLWSSIALLLSSSPFDYSESIIGLFGPARRRRGHRSQHHRTH